MAVRVIGVDVRLAVAGVLARGSGVVNVSQVCRELGISRDSFYRLRARLVAGEDVGGVVLARSRRPHRSPGQTPAAVEELIVRLRKELTEAGLDFGARSIRYRLLRQGTAPVPSAATVHRVLRRHGLVIDQPAKRPRASWRRFEFAAPNACWQIDASSWWLADRTEVVIIQVLDDHSRRLLASRVAPAEVVTETWACLAEAMARHGRPQRVLSDRGTALCGDPREWNTFRARLAEAGVAAWSARPNHPQTCGKNERSHQTLQLWLRLQPPARSIAELQIQVDAFDRIYNEQRPHQALGGATPAERYAASPKAEPQIGLVEPGALSVREVTASSHGTVGVGHYRVPLGAEWAGASVTVLRSGDHVAVFHHERVIRQLVLDRARDYQPLGRQRRGPRPLPRLTRQPAPGAPAHQRRSARDGQGGAPAAKRGRTTLTGTKPGAQSEAPGATVSDVVTHLSEM